MDMWKRGTWSDESQCFPSSYRWSCQGSTIDCCSPVPNGSELKHHPPCSIISTLCDRYSYLLRTHGIHAQVRCRCFEGQGSRNALLSLSESSTESNTPTTTQPGEDFALSDYLLKNRIIIIIPSVFVCIFLILLFILLIRKLLSNRGFDSKQLETYSSVNYDDESVDELENSDEFMYSSSRLLVGRGDDDDSLTNAAPEYDCMSVDVTVSARESAIVDWNRTHGGSAESSQDFSQSMKTLPHEFWKR